MARYRMIKPEFWEDDKMSECSFVARLFYIALWNFSDDEGYCESNLKWLKIKCFPYDNEIDIEKLLNELIKIDRIEICNEIIWIKSFKKHQKVEKPKPSMLRAKFFDSGTPPRHVGECSPPKVKRSKVKKNKVEEKRGDGAVAPTPAQTMETFISSVEAKDINYLALTETLKASGVPESIISAELDKFVNYWTERGHNGKKQRWEYQKVFEVPRRLTTWFNNCSKFSGNKQSGTPFIN